ncbi:ATP-binding cassette domain-containing protein [Actinoplanes sp. LDG1-06]|uniref:ATP-binding cassette domain-containing protein n=1 Tax=Paractinoplanes ovalisporus TaxID=2810368 RepID=A0ABS2A928_9ACTN|nr:ATP-binding cassette domain-containing protein [Actinoplanes ovalisporus]MBM2616337.1 ATP-binding cassette domain-containing protein [Actinoplanes ovalisporus]
MSELLAQCEGVSYRYGALTVLRNVGLQVHQGEVVGLLGANGAGKTTLIRLLLGLLVPSAGRVSLFGEVPSRRSRRRIGYVPQGFGLYEDLTAAENLDFVDAAFGVRPPVLPAALAVPPGALAGALSLGLRRRLAFAAAFSHAPGLYVLDEPTSGVDALGRTRLWDVIHEVTDGGAAALVSTHSMEEAEECDRLVMLAAGRRVADGTVTGIVGDSQVVVVEGADWPRALRALEQAGLRAALVGRTLRVPGASLESVRSALSGTGAVVRLARATLEERFVELTAVTGGPDA